MPGKYVMLNPDRVNLCGEWDPATDGSDQAPPKHQFLAAATA